MQRHPILKLSLAVVPLALLAACGSSDDPTSAPTTTPAAESEVPSVEPSPSLDAALLDRRWTILFVGTDMNASREAAEEIPNTDALLLVSLSEDHSELTMVSLPRDTVDVPLPDGGTWIGKINALYAEQGLDALVGAMEALYGVTIDGHVALDMDDFTALVDVVDGVDVAPPSPLVDPKVNLDLAAGPQEIDAITANGYVRTRVDQDYGRMGRQQEVMLGLVERFTDPEREIDLAEVLDTLDSLQTDLPLDDLATLLELASRSTDADVTQLVIQPPLIVFEGDRGDGRGYVLVPDVEAIRAEVQELIGEG
jgi:LCP family protein required for cell wall assembly